MADNDAPGAWPILTPGSQLAGIIKGLTKHCFTQNIKALGLMVSEKIFFTFFPIRSLWRQMTPGRGHLGPQGHDWQDLRRVPLNVATYYIYIGFRPCGLREEVFFIFFPL